jgi:putative endonuclease
MFFVYVLRSAATGRHYVGSCADPVQRLGQHNAGVTKSTKNRGPWELVYQEEWPTRSEAMRREQYWKSGKGREELKRVLAERAQSAAE